MTGREVWISVEDSTLIVGPPQAGKGVGVVVLLTVAVHGSAIVASTRPDTHRQTLAARGRRGPVYLRDPQGMTGDGTTMCGHRSAAERDPLRTILRARAWRPAVPTEPLSLAH
ncbi:MAG: hypothetical protein ACXV5Q_13410 [Frankiaceae bacterium]